MSSRLTPFAAVVLVLACASPLLAGKGDKGKPGGGGETPADPAIAYIDHVKNGGNQLWVMDASGANPTLLLGSSGGGVDESAMNPTWMPDGTRILFEGNFEGGGIYVVNRDGTDLTKLRALGSQAGVPAYAQPSMSPVPTPDGTYRIAFCDLEPGYDPSTAEADVYVMAPDGTDVQRLIQTPDAYEADLSWSPDGTRLVVRTIRHGDAPARLIVYDLSVANGTLTATESHDLLDVDGSPLDGIVQYFTGPAWARTQDQVLVAVSTAVGSIDLWVIDVDDPTLATQLTFGALSRDAGAWSSDDSRIIYEDDGRIFSMAADGSDVVRLAGKSRGDDLMSPAWR